ncbi:MAG: hypothetical protein WDZ68_00100 [Candidatus Paceibacterota bacterium]
MSPEPLVKPLSHANRTWVFWILLTVFFIAVPAFVFYAIGYRVDLASENNITTVGGLYIGADADDVLMFVDEKPVVNMRIFQRAAYIQNLEMGIHRIHVQKDGLQTWVKELPVYAHIVTEAQAFNLPLVSQIRYIPEWLNKTGLPILISENATTTASVFPNAEVTNTVIATSSQITREYLQNTEHEYVVSLFESATIDATTESRRAIDVFQPDFSFREPVSQSATASVATTTKITRTVVLYEDDGEVYARWIGSDRSVPYYYCITFTNPDRTTLEYGEHVYESIVEQFGNTHNLSGVDTDPTRVCRDTIRVDRDGQNVTWFDFLPNSTHHVLMLLEDGLYVVEIDDRAWQNVQLLYQGEDLEVRVDGGQIYVFDGEYYFEVFTEIAS